MSTSRGALPFLGRGWSFPPAFTPGGDQVDMVSGVEDIHQSLRILLGTTPGERVMLEAFGCDLMGLQFEEVDRGLINRIERLVSDAILEDEPRIKLDRVEVNEAEPGCVLISVHYTVRGTNSRFNMVFPFYLLETARPGP